MTAEQNTPQDPNAQRTLSIRAALIRNKLLKGVPASNSTLRDIVNGVSDEDICRKDDESAREKAEWSKKKKTNKEQS